jgi:hypothetical protein
LVKRADAARGFLQSALEIDPHHQASLRLQEKLDAGG